MPDCVEAFTYKTFLGAVGGALIGLALLGRGRIVPGAFYGAGLGGGLAYEECSDLVKRLKSRRAPYFTRESSANQPS